ncbi:MAG: flagellar motor switch phosphatase FliY [Eubacteriales bacterium]
MSNLENIQNKLTDMETDVIGEVMNISMGAAATAISTILDKKVTITTPRIETVNIQDFDFPDLEPAIGVLIKYVEGIQGSNVLLLKEEDLKNILIHLLSLDPADEFQFDEISTSAVCEIMNQMMGSAASALASFLGHSINISPPEIINVEDPKAVTDMFALKGNDLVSIKFNLIIDGLVDSEFISALDPELAREIIAMSLGANDVGASAEEKPVETLVPSPQSVPIPAETNARHEQPRAQPLPQKQEAAPRKMEEAKEFAYKQLEPYGEIGPSESGTNNMDLIMSVPIQLTVELGRAKKKIRDIIELSQGNIIELDRQAGAQVDIMANGRLIAKGDVVVVDDNYSVRITEIVRSKDAITES